MNVAAPVAPPCTTVGILALQGAFAAHEQRFAELGVATRQIRTPDELDRVDGLVLPGGESTTMSMLLRSSGLDEVIAQRIAAGMAVFGTCAGMILLATEVLDGRQDQWCFGAIDITVRRNGYGRQVDSFESELDVVGFPPGASPFHGVFIRAPRVERVGPDVDVLATHRDEPVLLRHGAVTVAAFHPELTPDPRVHAIFLDSVQSLRPSRHRGDH